EKIVFFVLAVGLNYYLFLELEAHNEIITLQDTVKCARHHETFTFNELFN
ncbi:MAG: MBL fold metallo-hydrolase, partial [Psychroflexus sp.]|nr:MBL fold metallo-hydrolase [Psychroflexus sp.]